MKYFELKHECPTLDGTIITPGIYAVDDTINIMNSSTVRQLTIMSDRIWVEEEHGRLFFIKNRNQLDMNNVNYDEFIWIKLSSTLI